MAMRDWLPTRRKGEEDAWQPFKTLQGEIDKVFRDFSHDMGEFGWNGYERFVPDMEINETDKDVTLKLEIAGVEQKDVDISVSERTITISGEKKYEKSEDNKGVHRSECRYGSFSRSLTLPFSIAADKVGARLANGVLTVTVAKPADAITATKKIEITQ